MDISQRRNELLVTKSLIINVKINIRSNHDVFTNLFGNGAL